VWDASTWTQAHQRWLGAQRFEHVNTELAFIDALAACQGLVARRDALDERLSRVAREDEFWPLVRRLRAFRGIDTLSALIIVLEVGDFHRFDRAVQLGSWVGLTPCRHQSGEQDTHGPITKTGSRYARRILVEAAWHYSRTPRVGAALRCPPPGPPRPCPADRVARTAPPAPSPPPHARAQETREHRQRRVRTRALLLPIGRRHRPITTADTRSARGEGAGHPQVRRHARRPYRQPQQLGPEPGRL
jgi:hypothetical protein